MKRLLLAATASVFAMTAAPVWAQDAADEAVEGGDIIVTATRSETLLSKTPIAITAITGDDLRSKGITGPTDLGDSVPNLSIDRVGNAVQITIRGVSSTDNTEKGDPSAAYLLDGVYLARPQQVDVAFFDINREEVLRGPQGTSAKVTGLETEATITPSDNDRIDLSYSYTNARYSEYCPFDDPLSTVAAGANGCKGNALSFEGRPLDRSPKHVVSAGYAHTFPVGEGSVVASVRTRLSSSYAITNFGAGRQYNNPSVSRTDLNLTYNAPDDRFYVQGYLQNLENSIRLQRVDGFNNASPTDPRTYGIRAGFKF
jgi:outer membrane receptor protein involved in Fe transport